MRHEHELTARLGPFPGEGPVVRSSGKDGPEAHRRFTPRTRCYWPLCKEVGLWQQSSGHGGPRHRKATENPGGAGVSARFCRYLLCAAIGTKAAATRSRVGNSPGYRRAPGGSTGSIWTRAAASAAYLRRSSVIRIEQNLGPHMLQKAAVLKASC